MSKEVYKAIGLMSGTSCDGIDASLIETNGEDFIKLGDSIFVEYSPAFKKKLSKIISGDLTSLFAIENEIAKLHSEAVEKLLKKTKNKKSEIDLLSFHGQTIHHDPSKKSTVQIGNAQLLAALSGIDTVYDLRKNDVANGGQGAPLIPIFHKALMSEIKGNTLVVNIGGVSNVTFLNKEELVGFDVGTGNALINDFCLKNFKKAFDKDGKIASSGKVNQILLKKWLSDSFFKKDFPKSLDRNHFYNILKDLDVLDKNDAVTMLSEFTVAGIDIAIKSLNPDHIFICGGGRKNKHIMNRLDELNPKKVKLIDSLKLDGDFIESYGWGYIAVRSVKNLPITFPKTTGCASPLSGGVLARKA